MLQHIIDSCKIVIATAGVCISALGLFAVWLILAVGVVGVLLAIAVFSMIAWAIGYPIKVKNNDKVIGYIRWFTFTRV